MAGKVVCVSLHHGLGVSFDVEVQDRKKRSTYRVFFRPERAIAGEEPVPTQVQHHFARNGKPLYRALDYCAADNPSSVVKRVLRAAIEARQAYDLAHT